MIQLRLPENFNAVPMIRDIWPEPYATPAAEAYQEDHRSGQIFLITDGDLVLGLTGYFFDAKPGIAYLRWTGVRHQYRHLGYASLAIKMLVTRLSDLGIATKLVELVPDNEYGVPVKAFFESLGFVADDVPIPPNECSDWPCIAMTLSIQD